MMFGILIKYPYNQKIVKFKCTLNLSNLRKSKKFIITKKYLIILNIKKINKKNTKKE